MSALTVYDRSGKEVDTYEFDVESLAPRINRQLMHDAVVMYQANLRHGAAKTKSRAEVSGSTKKLYRQKGTGNARAGHRRSGVRRGGGHIFALRARDYSFRMPRKALRLATRMAIASKIRDQEVVVLDELSFDQPATKEMAAVLKALGLGATRTLVATAGFDGNVYKSARNIARVTVSPVSELNAYTVLSPSRMVVTRAALDDLRERFRREGNGKSK